MSARDIGGKPERGKGRFKESRGRPKTQGQIRQTDSSPKSPQAGHSQHTAHETATLTPSSQNQMASVSKPLQKRVSYAAASSKGLSPSNQLTQIKPVVKPIEAPGSSASASSPWARKANICRASQRPRPQVDPKEQNCMKSHEDSNSELCPASKFPFKPLRKGPAPGVPVELVVNMFKIEFESNKSLYSYEIMVDYCQPIDKFPAKVSRDIRTSAVKLALKELLSIHKSKGYDGNYARDRGGSTVVTTFDIPEKNREIVVRVKLDEIVRGQLSQVEKFLKVTFHGRSIRDPQELLNYCRGVGQSQDITQFQEHLRTFNIVFAEQISTNPRLFVSQSKSGVGNVFPADREFKISEGIMVRSGYTFSVRPGEDDIMLNVANTVALFYEQVGLIEYILKRRDSERSQTNQPNQSMREYILNELRPELKGKRVEAIHKNYGKPHKPHYRKYWIEDIDGSSRDKFNLVNEDGTSREVTIEQYFFDTYKVKLKYPELPCIIHGHCKLPIECCRLVENQRVTRKMNQNERKKAAAKPQRYFEQIRQNVEQINSYTGPLNDFGFQLCPEPIKLYGRELKPSNLVESEGNRISPEDGKYVPKHKFHKPAKINKFMLAFIGDGPNLNEEKIGIFFDKYCNRAKFQGVSVDKANGCVKMIPLQPGGKKLNDQELREHLRKYIVDFNKEKIDHAILVLSGDKDLNWLYGYLHYLETTAGKGVRKEGEKWTRTSCIKSSSYEKIIENGREGGVPLSNLWLKYNTKLGGVNYVLEPNQKTQRFLGEGCLFISVDVCHPAPGDKLSQSVAATVGMWDTINENMSYCTRLRVQRKTRPNGSRSTVEEVGEIDIMVSDIIKSYQAKKNGRLPSQIVILRDGVSEGQFSMVVEFEIGKVRQVLANKYQMSKSAEPRLACMVVQKRHKTRFKRVEPYNDGTSDDYNVRPGTVVDTVVTNRNNFDFFIAPHKAAIQGTSRAAHIVVLLDEIGFSQDEAQALIHALSYLSARCTRSTSVPTPVNLADLAAKRAKNLVVAWNADNFQPMNDDERIKKLNEYLWELGDTDYKNTLYYV